MTDMLFDNEWTGPDAVVAALKAVESGEAPLAVFAIAEHPKAGVSNDPSRVPGKVYEIVSVGRTEIDGVLTWRYCALDGTPDGDGSHGLCASWHPQDIAIASARLAAYLEKMAASYSPTAWVFRQRVTG